MEILGFVGNLSPAKKITVPELAGALAADAGSVDALSAVLGGGGGDGLPESRVHISSAQILAMHTTPPALTPAPGASQIIVPVSVLFIYNFVTTPYTIEDSTLYVSTPSDIGDPELWSGNGGSWVHFTKNIFAFSFSAMSVVPFTIDIVSGQDDKELSTSIGEELRLYTGGTDPGAQFTLGDGTLDVITKYYLLDYPVVPT